MTRCTANAKLFWRQSRDTSKLYAQIQTSARDLKPAQVLPRLPWKHLLFLVLKIKNTLLVNPVSMWLLNLKDYSLMSRGGGGGV